MTRRSNRHRVRMQPKISVTSIRPRSVERSKMARNAHMHRINELVKGKIEKMRKTFSPIKFVRKKTDEDDRRGAQHNNQQRQHNERNSQIVVFPLHLLCHRCTMHEALAFCVRRRLRTNKRTNERVFGVCNGINFVIIKSIYVNDKWKRLWILANNNSSAAHRQQSLCVCSVFTFGVFTMARLHISRYVHCDCASPPAVFFVNCERCARAYVCDAVCVCVWIYL